MPTGQTERKLQEDEDDPEEGFTCLLVNAAHIQQVPGRKTDIQDCSWIAQLLAHGLLRGKLRAKLPALRQALAGRFREHHAFLVSQLLAHLEYLEEAIETLSAHIAELIAPFEAEVALLDTIHGVNRRTAEGMVAELGVDMAVFPSDHHLASWAAYQILTRRVPYRNLGADSLDCRHAEHSTQRALHVLERQGYRVTLERAA